MSLLRVIVFARCTLYFNNVLKLESLTPRRNYLAGIGKKGSKQPLVLSKTTKKYYEAISYKYFVKLLHTPEKLNL